MFDRVGLEWWPWKSNIGGAAGHRWGRTRAGLWLVTVLKIELGSTRLANGYAMGGRSSGTRFQSNFFVHDDVGLVN